MSAGRQPWIDELERALVPGAVRTDAAALRVVSRDASHVRGAPVALAYPRTSAEVATCLRIAGGAGVPVVARGAGTSLAGGALPVHGGLVLAFNRMARLVEIDALERTALVEAGLVNGELDRAARAHGLRYAPDPSSRNVSTIGGNVGTNAGGLHCLGHGVTHDHVIGLEVALADGSIAWLDADDEGPDLRALVVGGEGTLAVVTRALVRLLPLPEAVGTIVCGFDRLEDAGRAGERMIEAGTPAAALEYMDEAMIEAVRVTAPGSFPDAVDAVLIVEVETLHEALAGAIREVCTIVEECGGSARDASAPAERAAVWRARTSGFGAIGALHPDHYLHDLAVPRDRLCEALQVAAASARSRGLILCSTAHLGDGNLHPKLLFDGRVPGAWERVLAASDEIVTAVLAFGGTLTGEHGIGLEKLALMQRQFGEAELDAMRAIRHAFDPAGTLNPGKAVPAAGAVQAEELFAGHL